MTVGAELSALSGHKHSAQHAHVLLIHPVQDELGAFTDISLEGYTGVRQL